MRTIKDHARNALCLISYVPANMSGVVFSFAEWMKLACEMGLDTGQRNTHPITLAYLIGLNSISGPASDLEYSEVLGSLESLIASKEVEGL